MLTLPPFRPFRAARPSHPAPFSAPLGGKGVPFGPQDSMSAGAGVGARADDGATGPAG